MKASELIEKLKTRIAEHGDLEVFTEGCDCLGDTVDVVKDYDGLITRS